MQEHLTGRELMDWRSVDPAEPGGRASIERPKLDPRHDSAREMRLIYRPRNPFITPLTNPRPFRGDSFGWHVTHSFLGQAFRDVPEFSSTHLNDLRRCGLQPMPQLPMSSVEWADLTFQMALAFEHTNDVWN